jgi:hypothetical protein
LKKSKAAILKKQKTLGDTVDEEYLKDYADVQ